MTAREGGHEDIGKKITDHGKDHGEPTERADFGHGTDTVREKANEKNRDLSLEAIEDGIGREVFGQANDFTSILRVLGRTKIDNFADIAAQQSVLQKQSGRRHSDGHTGVQKDER